MHFCAFFLQKLYGPKFNYQIYDKKFIVIIRTFEKWKLQLSGIKYEMLIYTNYKNLTHFTTSKILNKRQIKWLKFLLKFHFRIIYRKKTENGRADVFNRKLNYENTIPVTARGKHSTEASLLAFIDENSTLRKRKETNKILRLTRRR